MKAILTNPRSAAILSFMLALPCTLLFSLLLLNIEPTFGPLQPLMVSPDPDQPDVVGSLIALTTFLLLLVAFIINFRVLLRAKGIGRKITDHPLNLVLASATFVVIAMIVGGIVVDQYPCWIGVPNCD